MSPESPLGQLTCTVADQRVSAVTLADSGRWQARIHPCVSGVDASYRPPRVAGRTDLAAVNTVAEDSQDGAASAHPAKRISAITVIAATAYFLLITSS